MSASLLHPHRQVTINNINYRNLQSGAISGNRGFTYIRGGFP